MTANGSFDFQNTKNGTPVYLHGYGKLGDYRISLQ